MAAPAWSSMARSEEIKEELYTTVHNVMLSVASSFTSAVPTDSEPFGRRRSTLIYFTQQSFKLLGRVHNRCVRIFSTTVDLRPPYSSRHAVC